MPGILYHLSFAEEVYKKLASVMPFDRISFLSGNLIPDLATNKQQSHYRKKASVDGFFVPEIELAKKDLFMPKDPLKFGMFSHLYLDYYFIEGFLIPEFIWDSTTMTVINPRNSKKWNIKNFFSPSGMYGAYTEIQQLLLRDNHITFNTIEEIPAVLPNTGLAIFDARHEKTWKSELKEYLAQEKEYTGEIFDYSRLWSYIERIATQFAEEFSK